jgi:hypothetical protein
LTRDCFRKNDVCGNLQDDLIWEGSDYKLLHAGTGTSIIDRDGKPYHSSVDLLGHE